MNRTPIAISIRLIAVASVVMLLLVAACSSSDDDDADATTTPTATSTADASTPTPAGTTAATSTPGGSTNDDPGGMNEQVPANGDDLVELGKALFFGEAGSFGGCAVCHGQNAEGLIGPPIVGKRAEDIELQLDTNEAMMGLGLSDAQVEAVAAYLQSLAP